MYLFRDILAFRSRAAVLGFLLLTLVCGAHSQTLQGDWQGTLAAPGGNIACVFHLDANGGGTLTAQGNTVPLNYSANGSQVAVTVSQINGSYTATVNGNQMSGTWTQSGGSVPLTLTKAGAPAPNAGGGGSTAALQGDWQGTLAAPNGNLPLVFHLGSAGGGTVDSPAQQFSAPLQYSATGNKVTITVASIRGSYAATVNGNQMSGTWTQNDQDAPLTVTKH
jgi:hypothetical protein